MSRRSSWVPNRSRSQPKTIWGIKMQNRYLVLFAAIVVAAAAIISRGEIFQDAAAGNGSIAAPGGPTDTIIVRFQRGAAESTIGLLNWTQGVQQVDAIPALGLRVLRVPPGKAAEIVAAAYAHNPLVEFAEPNVLVRPEALPNDPNFSRQWHLPKIDAPTAWDSAKASGVLVGVCDTGVSATQPDLVPVLRADLGWNAADGSSNWSDIYGHGTAVSGALAAATNNDTGVAGVAWGAQIIPVRISNFSDGSAYVSDAVKCINYVVDHGARVVNISYDMAHSASLDSAGKYAQSKGALTFVAAGNSGSERTWTNYTGFIAVSGTTSSDTLASWSSFGRYVDIAAPGDKIWTTWIDGNYYAASGTSLASPVAAGVSALIIGAKPSLSASQVEQILLSSADDLGSSGYDSYFGYGRVNAAKAVAAAGGGSAPPPDDGSTPPPDGDISPSPSDTTAPTVSITSPASEATLSGTVSVAANASDDVGVAKVEFYVDGQLRATATAAPYSFSWDTTTVPDGSHTLVAKAYDAAGNVGTSAAVSVTVANSGPTLITETFNGSVGGNGKNAKQSESHTVTVTVSGPMDLNLTWNGRARLSLTVVGPTGAILADGPASTTLSVGPGTYTLIVTALEGKGNYTLKASHY